MKKIICFLLCCAAFHPLLAENEQQYLRGYIASKLGDKFPGCDVEFDVQDSTIIFFRYPNDLVLCDHLQSYLESFDNFTVIFNPAHVPVEQEICCDVFTEEGDFLPELNPFFPTMLAQPHIVGYSVGYRSYDRIFKTDCLPVSIGDQFSLYQFKTETRGRLYFGIEACVWAIFEARAKSLSLINADYYIALPFTYINDPFSMRVRIFHESSHLGDEFLLEHPKLKRLNPSMEVFDLSLAYNITNRFTVFAGFARVLRSDESFKIKPHGFYYGFNYFLDFYKIKICNLEATPFIGTFFTNYEDHNWALDSSFAIGYQWDKRYGNKLRIYLEAHDGYSEEGQFSNKRTQYLALKIFYGY